MEYVTSISKLQEAIALLPRPLGFVPTMGSLHSGHASLVRRACADNRTVVVSIFVNPAQFGESAGYAQYPRDFAADLRLLRKEKVALVFAPPAATPPRSSLGKLSWVALLGCFGSAPSYCLGFRSFFFLES